MAEKKLNDPLGEVKLISTKGLTKDFKIDMVFLIMQNILLTIDHKIILYFNYL